MLNNFCYDQEIIYIIFYWNRIEDYIVISLNNICRHIMAV